MASNLGQLFYSLVFKDDTEKGIESVKQRIADLKQELNLTVDVTKVTASCEKMITASDGMAKSAQAIAEASAALSSSTGKTNDPVHGGMTTSLADAEALKSKVSEIIGLINSLKDMKVSGMINETEIQNVLNNVNAIKTALTEIKNTANIENVKVSSAESTASQISSETTKLTSLSEILQQVNPLIKTFNESFAALSATGVNTSGLAELVRIMKDFQEQLRALQGGSSSKVGAKTVQNIAEKFVTLRNNAKEAIASLTSKAKVQITDDALKKVELLIAALRELKEIRSKTININVNTTEIDTACKKINQFIAALKSGSTEQFQKIMSGTGLSAEMGAAAANTQKARTAMDGLTTSSASVLNNVRGIKDNSQGMGTGLSQFFQQFTAAQLTVNALNEMVQGFTNALSTMVDFEKENSKLAAILGTNKDAITGLTASAEELGRTTVFTASQVTQLQIELAKLGFSKDQILESEKAILQFSQATGATLANAAQTAGQAIRMFGADASETERYVSAMAIATTKSALDFSAISQNLATFGPVASAMGFSIEDTLALFGQLRNAGFQGTIAMTALRNIFTQIADESSKLSTALGHPIKTLEDLQEGLKKMEASGVDVAEAMGMAGKRGGAQLITLIKNADSLTDLRDKIVNGREEFEAMADTMTNNVYGSIKMLQSAWQGLVLSFSEGDGIMKDSIDVLTKLISGIRALVSGGDQGHVAADTINVITKSIMSLIAVVGVYKGLSAARGLAISASYKLEEAALRQLIAAKQQDVATDVERAVQMGAISSERAAEILALRAEVAAQATATASKAESAIAEGADAAAATADAAAKGADATATLSLAGATEVLTSALLSNPLMWIAAIISGVAYATYQLVTAEDAETLAMQRRNSEQQEYNNQLNERRNLLNSLITTIKDETATDLERIDALEKLKKAFKGAYDSATVESITRDDNATAAGLGLIDTDTLDDYNRKYQDILKVINAFNSASSSGLSSQIAAIERLKGSAGDLAKAYQETFGGWKTILYDSSDWLNAMYDALSDAETKVNDYTVSMLKSQQDKKKYKENFFINTQAEIDAIKSVEKFYKEAKIAVYEDGSIGKEMLSQLQSDIQEEINRVRATIAQAKSKGDANLELKSRVDMQQLYEVLANVKEYKEGWEQNDFKGIRIKFETDKESLNNALKEITNAENIGRYGYRFDGPTGQLVKDITIKTENDDDKSFAETFKEKQKKLAELNKQIAQKEKTGSVSDVDSLIKDRDEINKWLQKYNKTSSSNGTSSEDPLKKKFQDQIRTLKEGYSEYSSLSKLIGKDKAINEISNSGLFKNLFNGRNLDTVEGYKEALKSIREQIQKVDPNGAKYSELITEINKELFKIKKDEISERLKKALNEAKDAMSNDEQKINIYDMVFKATGDKAVADRMSNEIPRVFDSLSTKWLDELNKMRQDSGQTSIVDFSMTENEAKEFFGDDGVMLAYYMAIKKRIEANGIDVTKNMLQGMKDSMSVIDQIAAKERQKQEALAESGYDKDDDRYKALEKYYNKEIDTLKNTLLEISPAFKNLFQDTTGMGVNQIHKLWRAAKNLIDLIDSTKEEVYTDGQLVGYNYTDNEGNKQYISKDNYDKANKQLNKLGKKAGKVQVSFRRLWQWISGEEVGNGENKAKLTFADITEDLGNVASAAANAASLISEFFAAIGDESTSETISNVTTLFEGVSKGVSAGSSFGTYGAVIGGVLGGVTSALSLHDKAIDNSIAKIGALRQEYSDLVTNLNTELDRTLGGVYSYSASATLRAENKKILEKYGSLNYDRTDEVDDWTLYEYQKQTYEQSKKANSTGSYYDTYLASLMAQRAEAQKQLSTEERSKNKDESKIEEYKQNVEELTDEIKYFAEDMAEELYGIDFKSWADDLSSSLVDAWESGSDAAEAYKSKVSDILKDVAVSVISQKYIQGMLTDIMNEFLDQYTADGGTITDKSMAILEKMYDTAEEASNATNAAMDQLEKIANEHGSTLKSSSSSSSSSISTGIKSITEETADLLASYINAIRADVASNRAVMDLIHAEDIPGLTSIAQAQLQSLSQIATNTGVSAEKTTEIMKFLDALSNGTKKINIK